MRLPLLLLALLMLLILVIGNLVINLDIIHQSIMNIRRTLLILVLILLSTLIVTKTSSFHRVISVLRRNYFMGVFLCDDWALILHRLIVTLEQIIAKVQW